MLDYLVEAVAAIAGIVREYWVGLAWSRRPLTAEARSAIHTR